MKLFILATCLLVGTLALPTVDLHAGWLEFKTKHAKTYNSQEEESLRQKIYLDNKQQIEDHNKLYEQGKVTYKLAMNHFGDLLHHERKSAMLGYSSLVRYNPIHVKSNAPLPTSIDWREHNLVTPVKDQGSSCGACWAFSTTGALEGQLAKKTGKLVSLSEQNLIDCSTDQGNEGCNGGFMDLAFTYIKENGGIDTEESYPYTGEDGTCAYTAANTGGTDTGFVEIESGNEDDLKDAIATVGPVSVGIDASLFTFTFYHSGVYSPWFCSTTSLDHGVLVVGYGNQSTWFGTKDYWLVKNSWGSGWGEDGYVKIARNGKNTCGIATQASYPIVVRLREYFTRLCGKRARSQKFTFSGDNQQLLLKAVPAFQKMLNQHVICALRLMHYFTLLNRHAPMDPQTVMIKDIRQGMKNLVMTVIVLDIGPPVQVKEREVRTLKVADATACINLSLWGDAGNHLVPGDIIRLSKAHVHVYRNCITLLNGKACEVDKIGDFCMVFNEQLNMSEPNLELGPGGAGKNGGGPPHQMIPGGPPPKPMAPGGTRPGLPPGQDQKPKMNSGNGNKGLGPRVGTSVPPLPPGVKTNPPRPDRR